MRLASSRTPRARRLLLLAFLATYAVSLGAAEPTGTSQVTLAPPYSAALSRASASRKNVLVVFSNPHCGPCHAIERSVFGTPVGIDLVNASYVPVVLVLNLGGTDKTPETPEARSVATSFGIAHPPHVLVVSRHGTMLGRISGISRAELFSGLRSYSKTAP